MKVELLEDSTVVVLKGAVIEVSEEQFKLLGARAKKVEEKVEKTEPAAKPKKKG